MYATPSWIPSQISPAVVTIENIYVKIEWTAPASNGAEITAYKVLILASDNISWLEAPSCQHSDHLLVENLFCYIPMSELTEPALSLAYNSFISVKVQAFNLRGWGSLSDVNTNGARVEIVPVKNDLPMNGVLTTETQIDVNWNPLTTLDQMGGSTCTIITYNLEWDKGTEAAEWEELTGIYSLYTESQFLQTVGVSSGNYYQFRVRAKNKYGWGEMSDAVTILAAI